MSSIMKIALAELMNFSIKNFDISLNFFCNFVRQYDFVFLGLNILIFSVFAKFCCLFY